MTAIQGENITPVRGRPTRGDDKTILVRQVLGIGSVNTQHLTFRSMTLLALTHDCDDTDSNNIRQEVTYTSHYVQ